MNYRQLSIDGKCGEAEFLAKHLAKETIVDVRRFVLAPAGKRDFVLALRGKRKLRSERDLSGALDDRGITDVTPDVPGAKVKIVARKVSPVEVAHKLIAARQGFYYDGPRGDYFGFRVTTKGYQAVKDMGEILRVV